MSPLLPPEMVGIGLVALVSAIKAVPAGSPLVLALRGALARTLQVIWASMCGLSAVTMLSQFTVKEYGMDQEHVTNHHFQTAKQDSGESDFAR
jgi:hypothetical protein